jgi:ribose transport system permease protein
MSRQIGPILAVILILLLLFGLAVPHFLEPDNLLDLFQQISVNAILALGISLTILIGGIDLSVGAVLAVVGTTTAYILTQGGGEAQSPGRLACAVLAGLAVAASFGVMNGALAARTRMPPFIITLGTMEVARGAALRFNENKPIHIPDRETAFLYLGNGRWLDLLPIPVLVMAVIFLCMAVLLHRTRFGQHLYAIGGNREAARYTGIAIARIEIIVYLICALLAGVAGMINTSQLYSAEPGSGAGFELNAIAAAVVGGTSFTGGIGTMYGTLLGAIVIGLLDKGLNQYGVHFSIQHIIKGLVVLGAVYVDVWRRR